MKQISLAVLSALILVATLAAQVPRLVNYQGRVAVGAVNFQGTGQFKFALVNPAGTITHWSNDGTSVAGSQPTNGFSVTVTKGLYSVLLGDTAVGGMVPITAAGFNDPDVRLRVWFNDGANGWQLLTPDQRLAPTAYLADASVTAAALAPGAVTTAAIAPNAVTAAKVGPGALNGTHLAANSLSFSNLAVPAAPGAGQILGFNGSSLVWQSAGADIFSLNGTNAFYNSGNVGLGTNTPLSRLDVRGDWGGEQGAMQLLGSKPTLRFTGGADVGNHSWILHLGGDGPGNLGFFRRTGTNAFSYSLALGSTTGNVGIGQVDPNVLPSKLQILGQDALLMTGFQPFLSFRDGNAANARSRIQGVGGEISFQPESFVSGSNGNNYAALQNNGNFTVKTLTIRGGADLAEPFQMSDEVERGSVVVIDEDQPGRLKRSTTAYDRRVAGIISGANGVNPGISLHQEGVLEGGQNVALSGRVYVRADTTGGPIRPGDLLTTSHEPGRAMRVENPARAQGAVIGKAMTALAAGDGMVLVLVSLQ